MIHSEEDRRWLKGTDIILCPTGGGHVDVDRIRNAHQHDLEIVLPYLLIAPIWLNTSPLFPLARMILPAFAIVSISYTLLHMRIVNVHRYCKIVLSTLELCILIYMSVTSLIHYAWFVKIYILRIYILRNTFLYYISNLFTVYKWKIMICYEWKMLNKEMKINTVYVKNLLTSTNSYIIFIFPMICAYSICVKNIRLRVQYIYNNILWWQEINLVNKIIIGFFNQSF